MSFALRVSSWEEIPASGWIFIYSAALLPSEEASSLYCAYSLYDADNWTINNVPPEGRFFPTEFFVR